MKKIIIFAAMIFAFASANATPHLITSQVSGVGTAAKTAAFPGVSLKTTATVTPTGAAAAAAVNTTGGGSFASASASSSVTIVNGVVVSNTGSATATAGTLP